MQLLSTFDAAVALSAVAIPARPPRVSDLAVRRPEAAWRSPIDGQTLDGWYACNGSVPFTVANRAIVGRTVVKSPNSFLCSTEKFSDFVYEHDVWTVHRTYHSMRAA